MYGDKFYHFQPEKLRMDDVQRLVLLFQSAGLREENSRALQRDLELITVPFKTARRANHSQLSVEAYPPFLQPSFNNLTVDNSEGLNKLVVVLPRAGRA